MNFWFIDPEAEPEFNLMWCNYQVKKYVHLINNIFTNFWIIYYYYYYYYACKAILQGKTSM